MCQCYHFLEKSFFFSLPAEKIYRTLATMLPSPPPITFPKQTLAACEEASQQARKKTSSHSTYFLVFSR
jgi:hypothetical protein